MTVADEFRRILLRETHLSRYVIETATFDALAQLMASELGMPRVRELGWGHVVAAHRARKAKAAWTP
jgi:hypothetical protein